MKKLFSFQIIKQSLKSAWIWWLIFIAVTSVNLLAFPSTETDKASLLNLFIDTGIAGNGLIFTIIFAVMFSNIFITSEVDRGTLAVTLNTPTTRRQILFSKTLIFVTLLLSFVLVVGIVGALSPLMYGIDFAYAKWWTVILLWLFYALAAGGIAFAIGCWFNKSRYALALSSLVLGAFFIFSMLSAIEDFEFLKYFTLQTLFDTNAVVSGQSVLWQAVILAVIAIPFYIIGIIKFSKKDLPI